MYSPMDKRDKLQEEYEDALFALMMQDVMEAEGAKLVEENERLKNDPSAAVPDEVVDRCLKAIKRAKVTKAPRANGRSFSRILTKVCVAAIICMALFMTACAGIPEFRATVLNLLIEISDISTDLIMTDETTSSQREDVDARIVYGYSFPTLFSGFVMKDEFVSDDLTRFYYVGPENKEITVIVSSVKDDAFKIDTEGTQCVEPIRIFGFDGFSIKKGEDSQIVWSDTQKRIFIDIVGIFVDMSTLDAFVEGVSLER